MKQSLELFEHTSVVGLGLISLSDPFVMLTNTSASLIGLNTDTNPIECAFMTVTQPSTLKFYKLTLMQSSYTC